MRTGRTIQSTVLRKAPSAMSEIKDELEPDYPLTIVHRRPDGWIKVIALPKGSRDEAQDGYIWHALLRWDEPPKSKYKIDWPLVLGPLLVVAFLVILVFSLSPK